MPQCQFLFYAIFVFQNSCTGNILRTGRNKSRSSYFSRIKEGDPEGVEEGPQVRQTMARRRPRAGRAWALSGLPGGLLLLPFWLHLRYGKIRYWVFVPCNSENISCTTFLKYKNSRKQELALRHLVNRLVPENA